MKKVILAIMLLASIQSNAQKDSLTAKGIPILDPPNVGYYYGTPGSNTYAMRSFRSMDFKIHIDSIYLQRSFRSMDFKIHIDSIYLQRIIEALEERGYTLVKLPKKQ